MATVITANPDPPVAGQAATFCIDPPKNTTLQVQFNPGDTTLHDVTKDNPCFSIMVPANAVTVTVTGGGATAYSETVA